jgi:carbon-monoxide dehydrogenase medium subunit
MRPASFEYHRAASLEHALELLAEYSEDARIIAGGQSLVPMMNFRLARPAHLIDVNRLPLNTIESDGKIMRVGALTRHWQMLDSPLLARHFPALRDAVHYIGHPTIRRNGSVGGSISHADPTAEWPATAVLADAQIVLRSIEGERRVLARDFYEGAYVTVIEPGEMVVAIEYPIPPAKSTGSFIELAERSGDFALASAGVMIEYEAGLITKAAVVCGGADQVPIRAPELEEMLIGASLHEPRAEEAGRIFADSTDLVDDHIASADFRRNLIAQLTGRAILKACGRALEQA